jgi:filamentous hemagglutinin family protein
MKLGAMFFQMFHLNWVTGHSSRGGRVTCTCCFLIAGLLLLACDPRLAFSADLPVVLRDQTGAVVRFQGANLPGQPFANQYGGQTLRINQFAERATLHWESFDIGENNEVNFQQPSSSSIALNRVMGDKSIINGLLTANGRIYLVNQNGILFTEKAAVNTHSLIASTLDIDDRVFEDLDVGIVNAINLSEGPAAAFDSFGNAMGDITVEAGASLESAKNGRIMIFAPAITNAGTIKSEEGQVVLAAAQDKVYIASAQEGDDLRGLLVEVNTGGDVTNLGTLLAERGNVSLLGLSVNQQGLARATTSVSLDGSIRLLAQDMNGSTNIPGLPPRRPLPVRTGTLVLGEGSVTEVVPEDSAATALDAQTQPQSAITLVGKTIELERNSRVTATGGNVDIKAVASLDPGVAVPQTPGDPSVTIAEGAIIDVSGDDQAQVSVARNYVQVEARGNELADSPLQRNGPIRNKSLTVDIREGTDFLNAEGSVNAIQRDIHERLSAGGEITVEAVNFTLAEGATLDFGGGFVTYTGANVSSSKLITRDNQVVDIADADPDIIYVAVLDDLLIKSTKWGVEEVFRSPFSAYEPGYLEGRDAGRFSLTSEQVDLSGNLVGRATAGRHQRFRPDALGELQAFQRSYEQRPLGGMLELNLGDLDRPDLVLGSDDGQVPAGNGYPLTSAQTVILSPRLWSGNGISRISIDHSGRVIVNRPVELDVFGELDLTGTQVLVQADIHTSGGSVALQTNNEVTDIAIDQAALVSVDGTIDVSGRWSNDSEVVNSSLPTEPVVIDGGSILIESLAGDDKILEIALAPDSLLDVSGGAYLRGDGVFTGGSGGEITLLSSGFGQIPSRLGLAGELRGFGMQQGGSLTLAGDAFRILPSSRTLAEDFRLLGSVQFAQTSIDAPVENLITTVSADTFQLGGFQSFDLIASLDLAVAPDLELTAGTVLNPKVANRMLDAAKLVQVIDQDSFANSGAISFNGHPAELAPSGLPLETITDLLVLPDFDRAPVDLTLTANTLEIGADAAINADPGAQITLHAAQDLLVDGTIDAPAGSIALTAGSGSNAFQSKIWLGSNARLLATGVVRIDPVSETGLKTGDVLDAGQVTLVQQQGSIVAEPGAAINVDAVAATLNVGAQGVASKVSGDAGEVAFTVANSLLYSGTLSANSAGQQGGELSLVLDPRTRDKAEGAIPISGTAISPRGPHTIVFADFNGPLPGQYDPLDPGLVNTAFVPLEQLMTGGFDAFAVKVRSSASNIGVPDTLDSLPVIEFPSDVQLALARSISLDAAVLRTTGSSRVVLDAPYVAIGSTDTRVRLEGSIPDFTSDLNGQDNKEVLHLDAIPGAGQLHVQGELIELVGEAATQGFGGAGPEPGVTLSAAQDVRMRGVRVLNSIEYDGLFRTAGDLTVQAQHIYPTTLTDFELSAQGPGAVLEIRSPDHSGVPPLSVGGALSLNAETILQGGSVLAPLGRLGFNAGTDLRMLDGSFTSTSAAGVTAPFFVTQPGGDLVLPGQGGENQIVFVESIEDEDYERLLPQQQMELKSPDIDIMAGAVFDVRGGDDIRATEFQPGPGGSRDILLADLDTGGGTEPNPSFAILPGGSVYAPYDPLETPAAESLLGLMTGDTLVLEEGITGVLSSGEYAILPARYALFGGFLVTPLAGSQDLLPGQATVLSGGESVLAGRYGVAGNDSVSSRSQGFVIEDGDAVRKRAEYLETALEAVYSGTGSRTPIDAGAISIEAQTGLQLAGRLVQGVATGGLRSQVDIVADSITIQSQADGSSGITLLTSQIEQLGAGSLLIGGRRTVTADGLEVTSSADEVTVAAGLDLILPELILTADRISVESGGTEDLRTSLQSQDVANGDAETLVLVDDLVQGFNGNAAVLAVSNRVLGLERSTTSDGVAGNLAVAVDAALSARGSIIADAVGDAGLAGAIDANGSVVSLGGASVSLGQTDGRGLSSGLVLSNDSLSGLAGSELRLRSGSTVSVYGDLLDSTSGAPIAFQRLVLDARGMTGFDNQGSSITLTAESLELGNSTGASPAPSGLTQNDSTLDIVTRDITLNDGEFAIQGYETVSARVADSVFLAGDGQLLSEADLSIQAPVISAAAGVDMRIAAQGAALGITGGDISAALPAQTGLSASLSLQGDSVSFGGRAVLPSGRLELLQTGDPDNPLPGNDLVIEAGAVLDVAGITLDFGQAQVGTQGGSIHLSAETGAISIGSGSLLDVSPSPVEGVAGQIVIESPNDVFAVAPDAALISGSRGAEFYLDANMLQVGNVNSAAAYTDLNVLLGSGDFSGRRDIRLRDQDILFDRITDQNGQAFVLRAHNVRAVSDTGSVLVRGTIDASGDPGDKLNADGGSIVLAAGDSVDIEASAVLQATGAVDGTGTPVADSKGGLVEFYALDADGSDATGVQDMVNLSSGALIDVSGGASSIPAPDQRIVSALEKTGGKVLVYTRRLDSDLDDQSDYLVLGELNATIRGADNTAVVATRTIRDDTVIGMGGSGLPVVFDIDRDMDGDGSLDAASITIADIQAAHAETAAFMQNTPATVGGFRVEPGLVFDTSSSLVLQDTWDFYDGWHFGRQTGDVNPDPGTTGYLTLRAGDDLRLEADLTDAYFDQAISPFIIPGGVLPDRLETAMTGQDAQGNPEMLRPTSWGIRVVAGADQGSADPAAVQRGPGDIELANAAVLRTGTNDLEVNAARNIILGAGSAIYTGGYNLGLSENVAAVIPTQGVFNADTRFNQWLGGGTNFTVDGGDIRVSAGGSIESMGEQGLPTEWQPRIGEAEIAVSGVAGVGGSGGGAIPTHWGIAFSRFADAVGALGGGRVDVRAGADLVNLSVALPTTGRAIAGAVEDTAYPGKFGPALETTEIGGGGELFVKAAGDIRGGSYHLGDGVAEIYVGGEVAHSTSDAATIIYTGRDARFSITATGNVDIGGMSDPTVMPLSNSQVSLISNLSVNGIDNQFFTYTETSAVDIRTLAGDLQFSPGSIGFVSGVAPRFRAVSGSGDVVFDTSLNQYPSPSGQLELLAYNDLLGTGGTSLLQLDQDATLQQTIDLPTGVPGVPEHALVPVHANDSRPNLFVAGEGSIKATAGVKDFWTISLAKQSVLSAGTDLENLGVAVQNINAGDVTAFLAGRDIVQNTQRDGSGKFEVIDSSTIAAKQEYKITGPGSAQFVAGRRISLGTSQGIESIGNAENPVLPDDGADLLLMAGLGGVADHDAFIQTYLIDGKTITRGDGSTTTISYGRELDAFLLENGIPVLNGDPVETFRSLVPVLQRPLISRIFFAELKESGIDAQISGSADFSRGFDAIDTLFPQNDPGGGISMLLSQVQTLDGGGIDMLVPGGLINAGAADADIIRKDPADLGIVTARKGDINIFVDNDFLVNSTRAFALQGDLLVWSSSGDIDAGRGAKTVRSVPDPITRIDQNGQTVIEFPPAVEGSGLQGQNAFLFAPQGVVNAGDAGIRATGNLTIAAVEVVGADNIDVGGVSIGVPVATSGVGAAFAGASNATASATSQATETASAVSDDNPERNTPLGILAVEVLGFGECEDDDPSCS